jgi:hypothetical protein
MTDPLTDSKTSPKIDPMTELMTNHMTDLITNPLTDSMTRIMYCIRSDYHCLFHQNKPQPQHNYLLSVGISYQPSPRLDVLCFETYII